MKKVLSIVLVLMLAAAVLSATALADGMSVTGANASGKTGQSVTVTFSVANNPGISCADIAVTYDSAALELTGAAAGSAFSSGSVVNETTGNVTFYTTAATGATGDGALVSYTFTILGTSDTDVQLSVTGIYDYQDNVVSNCSATAKVTITHDHNLTKTAGKAASCTEGGSIDYWTCSICNKIFSDAQGTTEITEADIATSPLGHNGVKQSAGAATCTEAGYEEHYKCSRCGKLFSDAACTNEIDAPKTVAALGHDPQLVEAKPATCTEDGYEAYYKCSRCDTLFSDAEGENIISNPITIEALDHDWGTPTYVWDGDKCTATVVCNREETHVETETVTGKLTTTVEPKIGIEGEGYYTASFKSDLFETQQSDSVVLDALAASATAGEEKDLTVTLPEDIGDVESVVIGGLELTEDQYEVSGDKITIKGSALKGLSKGAYTVTVNGTDNEMVFTLNVTAAAPTVTPGKTDGKKEPKTGDESSIALWAGVLVLCGAAAFVVVNRKKNHG